MYVRDTLWQLLCRERLIAALDMQKTEPANTTQRPNYNPIIMLQGKYIGYDEAGTVDIFIAGFLKNTEEETEEVAP